jgi:hypothetical protein
MVPPLMQYNLPLLPVSAVLAVATQAFAVWQLVPEYPAVQLVHVQLPVMPPMIPPLTQ